MDGSSLLFVRGFLNAGLRGQDSPRMEIAPGGPIQVGDDVRWVRIEQADRFEISYLLSLDHPAIDDQRLVIPISDKTFMEEIAAARTYAFLKDVEFFRQQGIARGGSLENAVVVGQRGIINEPLRYRDEFVRHKVLDLIGDLALIPGSFKARITARNAGHQINHELIRQLKSILLPAPTSGDLGIAYVDGRLRVLRLSSGGIYSIVEGESTIDAVVHFVRKSKQILLQAALEEFEYLINKDSVKEEELHRFFKTNPSFLLTDDYRRVHSKIVLDRIGGPLIPDFLLEPVTSPLLCDIVELKLPKEPVVIAERNRKRFSAAVNGAVAQLREYRTYFEDPERRTRLVMQKGISCYRPNLMVIIGRQSPGATPETIREIEYEFRALRVLTYDHILQRVKARLDLA